MPPDRFRSLEAARKPLLLAVFGAGAAREIWEDDMSIRDDYRAAVAALEAWDTTHASEWNRIKPWYAPRIGGAI